MKKVIGSLLVIVFFAGSFSFAKKSCIPACKSTEICMEVTPDYSECIAKPEDPVQDCNSACTDGKLCNCTPTGCKCEASTSQTNTNNGSSNAGMGIKCDEKQLVNGQCKLNIYNTLGIRKSVRNETDPTSVGLFVQDVILSATFFIGTLVTVALIVSGIMFIFAASSGKDPANAKKGIMGSLVGLLIVVSSYVIIRLVQYIAKGF